MSKKDYIKFANMIKRTSKEFKNETEILDGIKIMTVRMCVIFSQDNPNFDITRFYEYLENDKMYKER